MYDRRKGFAQDYAEAAKWYRRAAMQGHAPAQYNLGSIYGKGEGVPMDIFRAHLWFNLAAANGDTAAVKARDSAASKMTQQQIVQAQKLARECLERGYKGCDRFLR